jgi:hypothetical protein
MSSETGKRNPDRLNNLGVVVVGICGAVMVYVSIALLQAFYMNDTAQVETLADYGGQDSMQRSVKAEQMHNLDPQPARNATGTYSIKIDKAIDLVVRDAKTQPENLVPALGPSTKQPVDPHYGRPAVGGAAPAGAGAGSAAPAAGSADPGAGSGAGSAAPAAGSAEAPGAGSAAPTPGAGSATQAGSGSAGSPPVNPAGTAGEPNGP